MSMITTSQELHWWASATGFVLAQGTHQAEEQRENQIKQCSDEEQNLMPLHDVGLQVLFSVAALLNLVFSLFFHLMSSLSKDETGRGCSPVQFLWCCDYGHACWSTLFCFFPFPVICSGSPPRGAISLVPLWFPWWFL